MLHQVSSITADLGSRHVNYLADQKTEYLRGVKDGYLRVLRTLARVMEDFERIPPEQRREHFDALLYSVFDAEQTMMSLYTVWKPDAIDGMDIAFIGHPGSCPLTGQYASAFTRETGQTLQQLSGDMEGAMAHLTGPNSRRDRVEDPFLWAASEDEMYLFRMMVPVVDPRTDMVVAGVGSILTVQKMRALVERGSADYPEITAMAVFAADGRIIAYSAEVPGGLDLNAAAGTLQGGQVLVRPFALGNSGLAWTVEIGARDNYGLAGIQAITRFTIVLMVFSVIVVAGIIFTFFMFVNRPVVAVSKTFNGRAQQEGAQSGISDGR